VVLEVLALEVGSDLGPSGLDLLGVREHSSAGTIWI
jgi:hypothetical protein